MVSRAINEKMLELFGECFVAKSNFKLEYFDGERGIIRCSLEALEKVMLAITLLDSIGNLRVLPLTVGVSGTINSCKRKYVGGVSDAHSADGIRSGDNCIQPGRETFSS